MIQETTGTNKCEERILKLLSTMLDGEPVFNERSPESRPVGKPFTTFMIFWNDGHGHVIKSTLFDEDTGKMNQRIEDDVYMTARIVTWGRDSMSRVNGIRMMLMSDTQQVQEIRQYLGVCDIDDAQSIPEPNTDGQIRERAYINLKFYARVAFDFDIDWFNKARVDLSVPSLSFLVSTDVTGE
jgi:hypothetical protein